MKSLNQLQKNTIWNCIAAVANTAQSVVVIMIVSRISDLSTVGIMTIGFSLANLFMMIGKFGTRFYQIKHEGYDISGKSFMQLRLLTMSAMVVVSFLYIFINVITSEYSLKKALIIAGIIFWYVVESYEDYFIGNYQIEDRLDVGNQLFVFRWVGIILTFAIASISTRDILVSIFVSDIMAVVIEVVFLFLTRKTYNPHICEDQVNFWRMFMEILPIFIGVFLGFFISNISKYAIDLLMNDEVQAIYGYVSIITFALPLLNSIFYQPQILYYVEDFRSGNIKSLKNRMHKQMVFLIALFSTSLVAVYFWAPTILSWVYNADLYSYRLYIAAFWIGGAFLAVSGFYTTVLVVADRQMTNMIIYIFTFVLGTALTYILVYNKGLLGATIGYVMTMFVQMIGTMVGMYYTLKNEGTGWNGITVC